MPYPGGKNGAGVYQRIINLMPPHRVYVEPFLGGGAILRLKRPAEVNIGIDLDTAVTGDSACTIAEAISGDGDLTDVSGERIRHRPNRGYSSAATFSDADRHDGSDDARSPIILHGDALEFLSAWLFQGDELVYCDPPYLMSTRTSGRLYRYEMPDVDHRRLLRCIRKIPAMVMISGYWSEMYAETLSDWNSIHFQAKTRGRMATEWLWFNFPEPTVLHDYRYLGTNFRERERITRKKKRWTARLRRMPRMERQALLSVIEEEWFGDRSSPEVELQPGGTAESGDGRPPSESAVVGDRANRHFWRWGPIADPFRPLPEVRCDSR